VLSNDFRVLSLFPDLKEAIQNSNLKSAHALVLQRLSPSKLKKTDAAAAKIRGKAITEVLTKDLSVSETKELVGTLIEKHAPKTQEAIALPRTGTVVKGLKKLVVAKIDRDELQHFRTELMNKLAEVEAALGD
jgi:ParB family chromosome partitioning protein